jgi:DNA-binding NtrC family response regulator
VPPDGGAEQEILVFDEMPFVVRSEASRTLLAMVRRVARYPNAVVITGETGSGKELVARAIHHYSLRCTKSWVDVNCAALPEHLVESELFGYEKGAFSGADTTKAGFFELAHQGTLFLDEIGDLEPKMQVKLLRVLDGVPYFRLGGNKKVTVDVRVVAATNRNLEQAVRDGTFRNDLYHRLTQIQLRVPPLRDRPEDVEGIAEFVLHQIAPRANFSVDALAALRQFSWPGNIRELKNVITRLAVVRDEPDFVVQVADLPPEVTGARAAEPAAGGPAPERPVGDLDSMEQMMVERALTESGGDQTLAADRLGISKRTLLRKLKQYRVESSAEGTSLGRLNNDQQRYFRATSERQVTLRAGSGYELRTRTVNISATGLGLQGVSEPFHLYGLLDIQLLLDPDQEVKGRGKITWADAQGKAGLRFQTFEPDSQSRLEAWLGRKMREEGWARLG